TRCPHATEAICDRAPEVAAARGIRHGQLDVRRRLRGPVEVTGPQPEERRPFAEREHLRGAPAASLVAEHGDASVPARPNDHVPRLESLDRVPGAGGGGAAAAVGGPPGL